MFAYILLLIIRNSCTMGYISACTLISIPVLQDGHSPLHIACCFDSVEAIAYLVGTQGMNVNERNRVSMHVEQKICRCDEWIAMCLGFGNSLSGGCVGVGSRGGRSVI